MRRGSAVLAFAVVVVACAHAPPKLTIDWRPAAGITTVDCNDSEPIPSDASAEMLRDRCRADVASACTALAEKTRLDADDGALVRAKLEPRCKSDARCGCARLGHALLWDRSEKDFLRAGDLLDASCHRGALDACDEMALQAELCAASKPSPLCERLKAQHRVPAPPEVQGPKPLPRALEGCFVVMTTVSKRSDCPFVADEVTWWGAATLEPPPPAYSPGSVVCFEGDRISTRPASGRWNQRRARWVGLKEADVALDEISGVRVEARNWDSVEFTLACGEGDLVALPGKWLETARSLPRVEAICDRMKRCVAAVARMFPPPPGGDDSPPPELPDDLLGCADYQARMTKLVPSPPPECR